ncbi:MAG: translation initiation factor IF-3 [Acidobacteriota bacterium]|nr:translation initiation factor IF-3 [Acidobacteriota bacterium]
MSNTRGRRVNGQIRTNRVRLIDDKGKNRGIFETKDAIRKAREKGLDLVEIAPDVEPPVCKMLDYGKYLYRQKKKDRKERKQQKQTLKEMKFYPKIEDHDYQTKLRHIRRFLKNNNPVRIQIWMRGREKLHPELSQTLKDRIIEDTGDLAKMQTTHKSTRQRFQFQLMPKGGNNA